MSQQNDHFVSANRTWPNGTNIPCVGRAGRCQAQTRFYHTPLVSEAHQVFANWSTQVVRLYHNSSALELEWTIGPVPIADGLGKEVISRINSDIESGDRFTTDANGYEMSERIRDYRATFTLNLTEPQVSATLSPARAQSMTDRSARPRTVLWVRQILSVCLRRRRISTPSTAPSRSATRRGS